MWFRLTFGVVFAVAVTTAARTARRAARRHGGELNQLPNEVRGLVAVRAVLGLVFYAALLAWLFWPARVRWVYLPMPEPLRWAAVATLIPVVAFFVWSFRTLDTNYRGGVGIYDEHALVTRGPYRRIRHPIYAAFIAIMFLLLPLSANWVLALAGLLLVVSIAAVRIPIEESQLDGRFGPEWKRYRGQTGCLLPRIVRR